MTDHNREADVIVSMRSIVKTFGSLTALAGVDFDVRRGEIHALLGENGAGKSTLMNILAGLTRPDSGTIELEGERVTFRTPLDAIAAGIGMVHQHFKLVPRLSVVENVILADRGSWFRRPNIDAGLARIRELERQYELSVAPEALVSDLSVGERQRVEILRTLYQKARILVLDEPTSTLTPMEAEQLLARVRQMADDGRSVIIITHHLDEVLSSADRITVLRRGNKEAALDVPGPTREELARLMVGRDLSAVEILIEGGDHLHHTSDEKRPVVLTFDAVQVKWNRSAVETEASLIRDLSFEVGAGEIVAIAGVEGNGQSELEEVLLGLRKALGGRFLISNRDVTGLGTSSLISMGLGMIPSDRYRHGLVRQLSIGENLVSDRIRTHPFGSGFWINLTKIHEFGQRMIEKFKIAARGSKEPAASLSGGNAQKVVLARALRDDLKALLAAQPTRGLDVGAIGSIWEHLRVQRARGLAVLLISTDLDEIMALADRCYVMYRCRLYEAPLNREQIGLLMGGALAGVGPS